MVIDPDQPIRPESFSPARVENILTAQGCPLCSDSRAVHGPQLYYASGFGKEASGSESAVKVIPNGRPILRVERELHRNYKGPYDACSGVGAHEVIVETPDHGVRMAALSQETLSQVFTAVRVRMADLRNDVRLRYLLYFKHQGPETGARFDHAHSQILATPEVPPFILEEFENASEHFFLKERCLYCDILHYEAENQSRLVAENSKFLAFAPYASARPFEVWISPKRHCHDIVDSVCEDVRELGSILKEVLNKLKKALDDPPFSMTLINSPSPNYPPGREELWKAMPHFFHWRLAVVPRVTAITGMDWDTGLSVNPVAPERAAEHLRSILP